MGNGGTLLDLTKIVDRFLEFYDLFRLFLLCEREADIIMIALANKSDFFMFISLFVLIIVPMRFQERSPSGP